MYVVSQSHFLAGLPLHTFPVLKNPAVLSVQINLSGVLKATGVQAVCLSHVRLQKH